MSGKHGMKILITGGAGFIGSHLAERLLKQQHRVAVVDNLDEFYPRVLKFANLAAIKEAGEFRFHEVDIRDQASLASVLAQERPDVIMHLAAKAGVRPSIEQAVSYVNVNVDGTVNVLEAARQCGAQKIVFASSSSVYGSGSHAPFKEEQSIWRPISPYAASKLAGELMCYTYAHLYDLPVVCLRFFTVYGPRQRPDLAIHKYTKLMKAGLHVPVFGDGTSGRDYTYIDDITEGILAAIHFETKFDIFNLGNSHPVLLRDLIAALAEVIGVRPELQFLPSQPGDVPLTWADISKAKKLLHYSPKTSLPDGLKRFVSWFNAAKPAATDRNEYASSR